ncbi:MAG TPA: Sip1-related alpha-galactosidase [Planctomycetota bacterium]|nr:Sip1-related alpha-galactosidase [Planctomycetota bacterium]
MTATPERTTTILAALHEVPPSVVAEPDPLGAGLFLRVTAPTRWSRHVFTLGRLPTLRRFVAWYRNEPWWMRPLVGTATRQIPVETQGVLCELGDGRFALVAPLIDGAMRAALEGAADGTLRLVVESDDPATTATSALGAFIAVGDDPHALMAPAAASVAARIANARLRRDKALPAFVGRFGWCTWDAFYHEVSQAKVRDGLESFRAIGVEPRFLILDDGWQSVAERPTGEKRLSAFAANEKFPGDLAPTVRMAKDEFEVVEFLVWHAFMGYWGGVDAASLPYRVVDTARSFSGGVLTHQPHANRMFGSEHGLVARDDIHRFFNDYHRHLRGQGVDGVKVDGQSSLEAFSRGQGGRADLMRLWHEALEGSTQVHFAGNLINCMSCSTDAIYATAASTLCRSSVDFWPDQPLTHGIHLWANAQFGMWFGEFVHPDWDMFQSGHPMGAFHAAGRAVSGAPIYVSDKPGRHDGALLRKLVLSDGSVLRADQPGLPTRACLFADPTAGDALLTIFNRNGDAGVVGAFNARWHEQPAERKALAGAVSPADIHGLAGDDFATWTHHGRALQRVRRDGRVDLLVDELGSEIVTVVPIADGVAPIGLVDKFNSAGAITAKGPDPRGGYRVALRDGGEFVAWCAARPARVLVDGVAVEPTWNASSNALSLQIAVGGPREVRLL